MECPWKNDCGTLRSIRTVFPESLLEPPEKSSGKGLWTNLWTFHGMSRGFHGMSGVMSRGNPWTWFQAFHGNLWKFHGILRKPLEYSDWYSATSGHFSSVFRDYFPQPLDIFPEIFQRCLGVVSGRSRAITETNNTPSVIYFNIVVL